MPFLGINPRQQSRVQLGADYSPLPLHRPPNQAMLAFGGCEMRFVGDVVAVSLAGQTEVYALNAGPG